MYFTRNNETSVSFESPSKTGSSLSYDRQFLLGTLLGLAGKLPVAEVEGVCRRVCAELRRESRKH